MTLFVKPEPGNVLMIGRALWQRLSFRLVQRGGAFQGGHIFVLMNKGKCQDSNAGLSEKPYRTSQDQ